MVMPSPTGENGPFALETTTFVHVLGFLFETHAVAIVIFPTTPFVFWVPQP